MVKVRLCLFVYRIANRICHLGRVLHAETKLLRVDTDAGDDNEEDDEEHAMMRTKTMVTEGMTACINHKPSGGDAFGIVTNSQSRIVAWSQWSM